jgi:hypothetical protein
MKNTKLKRYKQSQEKRNREKVIYALKELREATPSKILEFIDKQSEIDAKIYFEINNITCTLKQLSKKKKEFSMVIRTVKSILEKLTNENLVIHKKGGIYCLNKSINNFSFFPNPYGTSMIYSIGQFFPTTVEKSLDEFVNRYGLFIIFAFLQLLYFKYSNESENESISKNNNNNNNNHDIESWLKDAIPLKLMYDLFKKLYFSNKKQNTKTNNLKILNGLNKIIEKKYSLFYNEFNNKLKKNIELTKMIEYNTKEYNKAIDKMDEFLDTAERDDRTLKKREKENSEYELPLIFGDRTYSRVLPKDWNEQLLQLGKEESSENQK